MNQHMWNTKMSSWHTVIPTVCELLVLLWLPLLLPLFLVIVSPTRHTSPRFTFLCLCWCYSLFWGFPVGSDGKKSACNAGDLGSIRKISQRREWQPTPVFLPGESHGQRSLVGYSRWGCKALVVTEWLTFSISHFYSRKQTNKKFCYSLSPSGNHL